jgi:membrane-bound lytic murein transglycosylase B
MTRTRVTQLMLPALLWFSISAFAAPEAPVDYSYVFKKLRAEKVSKKFIKELQEKNNPEIQGAVVRLNVLGFLKKADYSGHLTQKAIDQCRKFMIDNAVSLKAAQKKYKVPKEVVAALLWVETRHGGNLGKFSTPAVFLNLAMADHPSVIRQTSEHMLEEVGEKDPKVREYKEKIIEVSQRKANWAVEQLVALDKMRHKSGVDIFELSGSYAGAFGWPQFIPSSYLKWARKTSAARKAPDLFNADDAIPSVAFYLKSHGWKNRPALKRKALYGYNKSTDYVETILTLAERIK